MKIPLSLTSFVVSLSLVGLSMGASTMVDIPESCFEDSYSLGFDEAHGNGMVGYTFQIYGTVTVSQIGWYDQGGDGLSRAFQVGMWKATTSFAPGEAVTQLLGNTGISIPSGTSAALNGNFRVVDLATPIELAPGFYQIAGMDTAATSDPIRYLWAPGNIFNNDNVSIGAFFYPGGMGGTPTTFGPTNDQSFYLATGMELGPMLFLVPEPSTSLLAVGGILMLAVRRRR